MTWSKYPAIVAVVMITSIALYACRTPTVQQPASIPPPGPVAISTSYQGAQVLSEVNQAKDLAYNSAVILKNLAAFGMDVIASNPTVTSPTPVSCADYGSYTYTGSVDASGVYALTLTFDICRMNGVQFDGSYALTGTASDLSLTLTSIRVIRYNDSSYSAITGTLALSGLAYSVSGFKTATDEAYDIGISGSYTAFDYVMLGDFTVRMVGLTLNYSSSIDPTTSNRTNNLMVNGRLTQAWPGGSLVLAYTGFFITKAENYSVGSGYTSSDTSVQGTVAINISPSTYGLSGIISVATPTTPIHHVYSTGLTSAGEVIVSGTGSATATFNPAGDIDVVVAGGTPVSFNREYFLNNMVNIFGMEQTLPQQMGSTGIAPTAKAAGSKWPATMTVTALSSGSNLGCYTDVHVNYYNPTDMLIPQITTFVDYHVKESCTIPAGIPFQQMIDIDKNGFCDFGLDIAAAQTDVTSGGVEHFTATTVPEGYYVISINNYSCGTDLTNMASIIIGDYMFGTYNCIYTDVSPDGTSPGAWCRLADIQVNTDGTVSVLSPDAGFNPWHN